MNLKRSILTIMTILAFVSANAKIATWSISPKYQELKRYYGDMYLFQNNGKWGIVRPGDKVLLQANYDKITRFNEGYSLAYNNENGRQVLKCIISENGHINEVSEKYYLNDYKIFSEGLMPIANKSGKYGYINPSGEIAIKCQFDEARIFRNGRAPIKMGNYYKYIKNSSDLSGIKYLVTDENFHNGDLTNATCFYDGKAAIRYNKDCALIGINGKKIKKLTVEQFNEYKKLNNNYKYEANEFARSNDYVEFSNNGKLGLLLSDIIVVYPQFDSFNEKYSDGNIIATYNGKHGLLRISDGDISIKSKVNGVNTSELEVDRNGNIQPVTYECSVPVSLSKYLILLDDGSGQLTDKTSAVIHNGNIRSLTFIPSIKRNSEQCSTRVVVVADGIVLADETQRFSVLYPIQLSLNISGPKEVRANADYMASALITAKISNDSNRDQAVTIQWSTGKKENVTVPAHDFVNSSIRVTETNIQTTYNKSYNVSLSTGDKRSWIVTFIPWL